MKISVLTFSSFVLLTVTGTYSTPIDLGKHVDIKHFNTELIQKMFTQKVTKGRLTDILSEIVGVDFSKLSDQAVAAVDQLSALFDTFQARFQKILAKSSVEFQGEIAKITLTAIQRFAAAAGKFEGSVSKSEIVIINKLNDVLKKLNDLKNSETVTKEEVEKIFEDFLETKFEGTIQDYFYDFKLNLEFFFIADEIQLSLRAAVQKEGAEMIKEVTDFIDDIIKEVRGIIRPFLDIIRPAVLPALE